MDVFFAPIGSGRSIIPEIPQSPEKILESPLSGARSPAEAVREQALFCRECAPRFFSAACASMHGVAVDVMKNMTIRRKMLVIGLFLISMRTKEPLGSETGFALSYFSEFKS